MAYTINGSSQDLAAPVEQDGAVFVPLAGIVEMLGGYVYWNNESKEAIVEVDGKKLSVTAGDTSLINDGEVGTLNAAPMILDSHLYVSVDFFEMGLGATVNVNGDDVTVTR